MKVPGPKVTIVLQKPTEARTAAGGGGNTFADLVSFQGSLAPLTAFERSQFAKETVVSTHRVIVGYEEIGDTYAAEVKAKNRLYVANAENELAAETFDIVGVDPFRMYGNKIATFEIRCQKVE